MRQRLGTALIFLLIGAAVVLGAVEVVRQGRAERPVSRGNGAPALHGQLLDGGRFDGTAIAGKVALVNFWATWCGPCREELPALLELERTLGARGVVLVAASMDEGGNREALVREFFAGLNAPAPLVFFPDDGVASAWKVYSLPTLYVLDRSGTVVAAHKGLQSEETLRADVERALAGSGAASP